MTESPRQARSIAIATLCGLVFVILAVALIFQIMLWAGCMPHPT